MKKIVLALTAASAVGVIGALAFRSEKAAPCAFCQPRVLEAQTFYVGEHSRALLDL